MYVTRPMSSYKNSPADLSLPPPEGPNSGILVVQDEEPTCCFGAFNTDIIKALPLPQNKNLELYYATGFYPNRDLQFHKIMFIPVLDQPLSSNRYYAVYPYGKDRGEGYTSSKVEDVEMDTCCFDSCGNNVLPQRFDPRNKYQQYEINCHRKIISVSGGFVAKSMAEDGFPPEAMWRRGWKLINSSTLPAFEIGEALGLDAALRSRLPDFEFPLKPVVVGKWYCPFIFVREGTPKNMKDIRNRSMYYEMTLEQRWEQVFAKDHSNQHDQGNAVVVDAIVQSEVAMVGGREAVCDERNAADDGVVCFRSLNNAGEETRVGLSLVIVERMKWEQGRVGWIRGDEGQVKVERVEEYGGIGEWKKFGCFVLIERFVLRSMDGSLVLTHDFKHTHQIRSRWE